MWEGTSANQEAENNNSPTSVTGVGTKASEDARDQ